MKKLIFIILTLSIIFTSLYLTSYDKKSNEEIIKIAYEQLNKYSSKISNKKYVIVVDFNQPITSKRLYLVDTEIGKVILVDYVGHSPKNGLIYPSNFTNTPSTYKSCYGAFTTQEQYVGNYGNSMRINGLDVTNNNARRRSIVFHKMYYIPYSLGCFATPSDTNKKLIDLTKNGSLLVAMYN